MALVNIVNKKDWKKIFSKSELNQLQAVFNKHFKRTAENNIDYDKDYIFNLKSNPYTLHPDTGEWDDTCGLRPKQVKKALKIISMKQFIYLLDYIQYKFNNYNNKAEYGEYSEDQNHIFYDFNEFFKQEISFSEEDILKHKKDSKERIKKEIEEARLRNFNYAIDSIRYGRDFFESLPEKTKETLLNDFFKNKEVLNKEILFETSKNEWLKFHGFIPKAHELLVINPRFWDKKSFLNSMDKLFKTRQFNKLDQKEKDIFIDLYFSFGKDLEKIPFDLVGKENNFFFNSFLYNESGTNAAFSRILSLYKKGIIPNYELTDLSLFNFVLNSNLKIYENFLNKKEIFIKDIDSLISIGEYTEKIKDSGFAHLIPYLMDIPEDTLKNIFGLNQYKTILELFDRFKDNNQILPTFKLKIKDYEFEVIDKSDIRGFIAGYPFSCQYIGGLGDRFTRYGYKEEDSTFMIVSKKGVIVAQSWIWTKDNQLTFDSIEWKGGLSSEIVAEGYKAYGKYVLDQMSEIDKITVGNCRDIFTKKIDNFIKLTNTEAGHCYDSETQYLVCSRK
jgi:hypothetical protein